MIWKKIEVFTNTSERNVGHNNSHSINLDTISISSHVLSTSFSQRSTLESDFERVFTQNQKSISSEMLNGSTKNLNDEMKNSLSSSNIGDFVYRNKSWESLNVPSFGIKKFDEDDLVSIKEYLLKAFKNGNHPLGVLIQRISECFSAFYWMNTNPSNLYYKIISTQALEELESISRRIFEIIRKLFPAIPKECYFNDYKISHRTFYSIILSDSIYSSLFVLYATKCSPMDEIWQRRVRFCDKKSDEELANFLKIDPGFITVISHKFFKEAINCFRQVEKKYCPMEMLSQIEMSFEWITKANLEALADSYILNTDYLIPLTIFLILRANIPQLGAELLLLEDLMGSDSYLITRGSIGACYTHVKVIPRFFVNVEVV